MSENRAGIYFDRGYPFDRSSSAESVYLKLPEKAHAALRAYLIEQQKTLGAGPTAAKPTRPSAIRKHEWLPGYTVHWRIALKPKAALPSVTRLSEYRIEVLYLETPARSG